MTRCANCGQPITVGIEFDTMGSTVEHRFASDCVRATVDRCIQISEQGTRDYLTGWGIAADIRKEFGIAPVPSIERMGRG